MLKHKNDSNTYYIYENNCDSTMKMKVAGKRLVKTNLSILTSLATKKAYGPFLKRKKCS